MSALFAVEILGARRVSIRFGEFPKEAHSLLRARIEGLTAQLYERVVGAAPHRTGNLRRQIGQKLDIWPNRITGRVMVTAGFAKAAALEYGSHRSITVKAHEMRLDHVFANRLMEPLAVMVGSHSRTTNIAAHKFLRGPLADMKPEILSQLRQALAEATKAA